MGLHATEIVLLAVYLVVTFGLAIYAGRRTDDANSLNGYFLAGRSLPWYLIGLSFYASNMSGASFVGLIGAGYAHGLAVFHYEWTAALVLAVFALAIAPVFLRARLFTVTEYLEHRFDRRTRLAYALFTLVTLLFIDMAGALYAGAVVLVTGLPFLDLWTACLLISALTGLYTVLGGLRTVVITDALQAAVLIAGALAVAIYGLVAVGGWHALITRLDERYLTLFHGPADAFMPWPGILGVTILGFYYWSFNQYFVQRALAARSIDHARWGGLFGGLLKLPNLLLMIVPGLIAAVLFPGLASPDLAFPKLTFELLPAGLRGIVLAAMLAAIMSSLDSALNAAASIVTMDVTRTLRPGWDDRRLFLTGRIATVVLVVAAALYAPLIGSFGSLFAYFQSTLAYLVPPFVAIYLGGLFWPRLGRGAAYWTLVIVEPVALSLYFAIEMTGAWTNLGLGRPHFTYVALALLLATFTVMAAANRDQHAIPADRALSASWRDLSANGLTSRSWLVDPRVLAALLLLTTAALLAALAAIAS